MAERRQWGEAIRKVQREGRCRVCGTTESVEAAHIIGRAHDPVVERNGGGIGLKVEKVRLVKADSIIPICRADHARYDRHDLDILALLTLDEQIAAVEAAGGIYSAVKRVTSGEML